MVMYGSYVYKILGKSQLTYNDRIQSNICLGVGG